MRWIGLIVVAAVALTLVVAADAVRDKSSTAKRDKPNPARAGSPAPNPPPSKGAAKTGAAKTADAGLFNDNAFPPTMPDTDWHRTAWVKNDCMRCHETGVDLAPKVRHKGMPAILLTAKCRTCHILIPGQKPRGAKKLLEPTTPFDTAAFPPMIPNSASHLRAWKRDDCMLCHEDGLRNAPVVKHKGMSELLLQAKCRTCHVQVRSIGKPLGDRAHE